ncbi:hypothetical protein [Lysobacter capsici]|uniref:hypothetical protein n=1 Tax=Lysobacter capsici TaxID=435897 RepID=UPI0012FE56A4|nr:hypothetical protein [Lysobacter capsici]
MVHAALAAGLPFKWTDEAVVLQEPELPSGVPDILLLRMNTLPFTEVMFSDQELKLLHFVSSRQVVHLSEVSELLRWTKRAIDVGVSSLEAHQFLVLRNSQLRPTKLARLFLAREIIAIEAKVGEWRRALMQARSNQWFASQSYVLLKGQISPSVVEAASAVGVGVLQFNGGRTKIVVRSERCRLPGSYASWLVSMWARVETRA